MIVQTKYFKSHRSLSSFLTLLFASGGDVVATLRDGEYIVLFYTKFALDTQIDTQEELPF